MSNLYGIFSWLLGSSDTNISVCAFFIKWMCKIFFIRMNDRLWTEVALAIAFEVNELKQSKDYFTLEHIFGKRIAKVAITKACWSDDEINFIWVVIVQKENALHAKWQMCQWIRGDNTEVGEVLRSNNRVLGMFKLASVYKLMLLRMYSAIYTRTMSSLKMISVEESCK